MGQIKNHHFFKAICIALIATFVCLDISYAYPPQYTAQNSTLATPSVLQQQPVNEQAARLQQSVFSSGELLGSICSIAKYLLLDRLPLKHLEQVLTAEVGAAIKKIDLSRVSVKDDVVLVPCEIRGEKRIMQVALKDNPAAKKLMGREWNTSDKYVIKDRFADGAKAAEEIVGSIQNGTDIDPETVLQVLDQKELSRAVTMFERYADRSDVHAFKRFRAYMILFGIYYIDASGKRFLMTATSSDNEKAILYKNSAFRVYGVEIDSLSSRMLEENGLKPAVTLEDYHPRIPKDFEGINVRSGVRIDMSSGFGGDHVLLAMELGSQAVNASILLKDEESGEYIYPIGVRIRRIAEPSIRIRSVDIGGGVFEIKTKDELFDFAKNKEIMLAKAAIVSSGIVPVTFRDNRSITLQDILRKFGGGFEIVTEVKGVPNGSGLGTSSALAATLVSGLVKFSGQSSIDQNFTDREKLLNVMRTAMVEKTLGSFGGYADACGIFPAIKHMTTSPGVFVPSYEPIEIGESAERELYDTLILTDGGNRQFSGDAAWQFTGLWAMGLAKVRQARRNTTDIGRLQVETMKKGDIQGFGRLEGEDYSNRITICPAGDNEYIRSVNTRLVDELGKDAFYYDVTGARGGAGGCYWINTKKINKAVFIEAFLRISKEEQVRLKGTFQFGGEPKIYDYCLNKKGIEVEIVHPVIDLDAFDDADSSKILKWRETMALSKQYEDNQPMLEYDIPQDYSNIEQDGTRVYLPDFGYQKHNVATYVHELPNAFGNGINGRVVHIANRPKEKHAHIDFAQFKYRGLVYGCGPRLCPYSHGHLVAGTDSLPQELDSTGHNLKFFLMMTKIFGEEYEGFFNAIAPTSTNFHAQFINKRMTIWDVHDIKAWPMKAELVEGRNIDDVARRALRIYNRYTSNTPGLESTCDVLMTFKEETPGSAKGIYRVILIPRLKIFLKPKSAPFNEASQFGTFGGVEVGGSFMAADKTLEAFKLLVAENGALYKRGMEEMSWSGAATQHKFHELIDSKAPHKMEIKNVSTYTVTNPSPEEALRYLVHYLAVVSPSQEKFKSYIPRLRNMRQDEFEIVSNECINEMRAVFNTLKRDNFFVMTEFLPEDVYGAYASLFRYMRQALPDVAEKVGEWKYRQTSNGFINISAFPDGNGAYFIDDYGMTGRWQVDVHTRTNALANRLVMRTIDSVHMAVKDVTKADYPELRIIIDDSIDSYLDGRSNVTFTPDRILGMSPQDGTFFIRRGFCDKSRDEQVRIIKEFLMFYTANVSLINYKPLAETKTPAHKKNASIAVVSLAMAEVGRARDYLHYKFNNRVQALYQGLNNDADNMYTAIETQLDYDNFVENYKRNPRDIVLFSLYQLKIAELDMLHRLVPQIKKINPHALIVLEGPVTIHPKQMLALCPEIDVMVRGEAEHAINILAKVKTEGSALTDDAAQYVLSNIRGGMFLRTANRIYISNLDRTNINTDIKMLKPVREMSAIWYTEHGCPNICSFCRKDTGGSQHSRIVPADKRIEWMLERLMLELDPQGRMTPEALKELLIKQAGSEQLTMRDVLENRLLPDTFIGRDKVEILVVSENALVNRSVIIDFAHRVNELGLQKYFKIKIADADINTLLKDKKAILPDREYMRALREASVYFIGFGSENISRTILAELGKGQNEEYPEGYTADAVITVNRALIEEGFDPIAIRHNMLLNTPDSNIQDVKSALLLMYLSPTYNSILGDFGNGWGNARNTRIYVMEGSLWTAADNLRYAGAYTFRGKLTDSSFGGNNYALIDNFYIARDTPEYVLRHEDAPLKYVDERIHPLCAEFAYPNFYRYRLNGVIDANFTDSDIEKAILSWKDPRQGKEVNALAEIVQKYRQTFRIRLHAVIKIIKAHMVLCRELSFVGYNELIEKHKNIPELLEACSAFETFTSGEELMVPGRFNPKEAMNRFSDSGLIGMIVKSFAAFIHKEGLSDDDKALVRQITAICLDARIDAATKIKNVSELMPKNKKEAAQDFLFSLKQAIYDTAKDKDMVVLEGYLGRMAYPDRQVFEYLKHLYIFKNDEDLFRMVVNRMNVKKINFPSAVKELVCKRMGLIKKDFTARDYQEYLKTVKEYANVSIYGKGGLLSQLRNTDPEVVFSAIKILLGRISTEKNVYTIKSIVLNLKDMAERSGSTQQYIFIVSPETLRKVQHAINVGIDSDILFNSDNSGMILVNDNINNNVRGELIQRCLSSKLAQSRTVNDAISKGDWVAMCIDGGRVVMRGALNAQQGFLSEYAERMKFGTNATMLANHIGRVSELGDRHVLYMEDEVKKFFAQLGPRPSTRYMMLTEEMFLYMLPIIRLLNEDPQLKIIVPGRGMEPFYNSCLALLNDLGMASLNDRIVYAGIFRRADYDNPRNHLIAQSIIPMLTPEESEEEISEAKKKELRSAIAHNGIAHELDEYLENIWGIKGGFEALMSSHPSRHQAIIYLTNFGLDQRFMSLYIKARKAYLSSVFMKGDFYDAQTHPLNSLLAEMFELEGAARYLTDENRANITKALSLLTDNSGNLLSNQRELIHAYTRIFGYADEVAALKNNMTHKARPLLNILLKDTIMAGRLSGNAIMSVDETSISGKSLLLAELIARAFNGNTALVYRAHNVSQRTEGADKFLKDKGVLDSTSIFSLWPQEDINGEYLGMYVDDATRERKFVMFRELSNMLVSKQRETTSTMTGKNIFADIGNLNKKIDDYIAAHKLFEFVDSIGNLRYDPRIVKREILKLFLRAKDASCYIGEIQRAILTEDLSTAIKINEADFPVRYIFQDKIREAFATMQISDIPKDITDLDVIIRYADVNLRLSRYMERGRELVVEYILTSHRFASGAMGEAVRGYLSGRTEFENIKKHFYEEYNPDFNKSVYNKKEIFTDAAGNGIFIAYYGVNGECTLEILSKEGLQLAIDSHDPIIRQAAKKAETDLRVKVSVLEQFIKKNKEASNDNIRGICEIVEDVLGEIRQILPQIALPIRVAFFDWDGTVVDTVQAGEDAFVDFYVELFKVSREEALPVWRSLDGKTLQEQYAVIYRTAKEKSVPFTMAEKEYTDSFIAAKLRNIENDGGIKALAVTSAVEFMRYLKSRGVRIHIASGFRIKELNEQISTLELNDVFDGVYGSANDDAEKNELPGDKAGYITLVLKKYGFTAKEAIMVGDTAHDVQSGLKAGVLMIGRGRDAEKSTALISAGADFAVQDFSDPNRIMHIIEEKMASSRQSSTDLFEVIESSVNSERAKFINTGNKLIGSLPAKSASESVADIGTLDKDMATAEIRQRVEQAISAIDKEGATPESIASAELLKKNLNQFEADGLVGSLIVLARKAQREHQKLYIGISTDWIPAYNNKHSFQHQATNSLINELKTIPEALRSMGLDNVEFVITETSEELAVDAIARVNGGQIKPSNAVIVASKKAVESGTFNLIKSTDKDGKAFIAGIDPRLLLELYNKHGESLDNQLNIDMMELLALVLEVATGKEPPQMPLVVSYDKVSRVLILLPSATIIDYDRLIRDVNKGRIQALQAA